MIMNQKHKTAEELVAMLKDQYISDYCRMNDAMNYGSISPESKQQLFKLMKFILKTFRMTVEEFDAVVAKSQEKKKAATANEIQNIILLHKAGYKNYQIADFMHWDPIKVGRILIENGYRQKTVHRRKKSEMAQAEIIMVDDFRKAMKKLPQSEQRRIEKVFQILSAMN